MASSLSGRQILLAGGSGGLGAPTVRLLAEEGAQCVASFHRNQERARELQPVAKIVQADLAKAEDRQALLDSVPELYGLVVFSGDPARVSDPQQTEKMLRHSLQANFEGPLMLAREAGARMKEQSVPGAIVLFATMQAVSLFPNSTVYGAAKAALLYSARILAKECRGPMNIRVNVIAPGVMQAGMAEASIAAGKYNRYLEDGSVPRFGRAADIARTVRFLLEPDNYITGQVITVDGGLTL